MARETSIAAGQRESFLTTRWSLLAREDLSAIVGLYWRPVYRFVRVCWKRSNEDAKDLTQAFFVHLFDGKILASADPSP
jgi:hypothetical protein